MKRIVIATCKKQKDEANRLFFLTAHKRSYRAYISSMGVEDAKGEAFTKEREDCQKISDEAERIYNGVESSYYVFAVDSFDEILPFVESEVARMVEGSEKDRDIVYLENLKTILKSLKQSFYVQPSCGCSEELDQILKEKNVSGFYSSNADCSSYLKRMMEHITGDSRSIEEMKFNFIEND